MQPKQYLCKIQSVATGRISTRLNHSKITQLWRDYFTNAYNLLYYKLKLNPINVFNCDILFSTAKPLQKIYVLSKRCCFIIVLSLRTYYPFCEVIRWSQVIYPTDSTYLLLSSEFPHYYLLLKLTSHPKTPGLITVD